MNQSDAYDFGKMIIVPCGEPPDVCGKVYMTKRTVCEKDFFGRVKKREIWEQWVFEKHLIGTVEFDDEEEEER